MQIQEYRAKELFREFGVPVLRGAPALSKEGIEGAVDTVMKESGKNIVAVKAQVLAGGRGKAGGIKIAKSRQEAIDMAQKMIGTVLHTHQTSSKGEMINKLYIEEGCNISKEYYLALMSNRAKSLITIMASTEGGMDIEEVASKTPDKVIYVDIDVNYGIQAFHVRDVCYGLKLEKDLHGPMSEVVSKLYDMFIKTDAAQIEINPLALVMDDKGKWFIALDGKVTFDDNALYRQKKIAEMRDPDEEDAGEREARISGLSYVKMDGTIGCMVNGAGLAMATMDIIKHYGQEPANFLDVGGGADKERVKTAFRIILSDPRVVGVLINIFGGIVQCDIIANGIVEAAREIDIRVPLVVRLVGTKFDIGKKILKDSGLNIVAAEELGEAAKKIVDLVKNNKN